MICKRCNQEADLKVCGNGANAGKGYFACPRCPNPKTGDGSLFVGWHKPNNPEPALKRQRSETENDILGSNLRNASDIYDRVLNKISLNLDTQNESLKEIISQVKILNQKLESILDKYEQTVEP